MLLHPDEDAIARAANAVGEGALVAMPTETVYGLAADATNASAVARLYAAKGRPHFNPLIAHVASVDAAAREGILDARARRLSEACWPGPLTLVVPVHPAGRVCDLARAGLDTIALRMPAHGVAQALLAKVGRPLVAPSANRSGRLSPTRAEHVLSELGDQDVRVVLDGGACAVGVESTIVAALPDHPLRVLRPGALEVARIEALTGATVAHEENHPTDPTAPIAPGQLASHYAPNASVRLGARETYDDEVLVAFGPNAPAEALNLSATGSLAEAAANLYAMLRQADATGAKAIAVMPIPAQGLGTAINDRLRRAAAPRDEGSGPGEQREGAGHE